jgi:hypothetical protein
MFKVMLSLIVGASLLVLEAAPASIGTVKSAGEFRVDGSAIRGNSTVFDGSLIETAAARTVVQISGAEVTLLPDSRVKMYRDRTELEKGSTLLRGPANHVVEAATLRIATASKDSVVQVELASPESVSVAARSGAAEVRNSSGVLVASLRTGMALAFDLQGGAATQVKMSGTLVSQDGKFLLTDATTNVKVELRGADLAKYAGKCVEIAGSSMPGAQAAAGASQVVTVVTIKSVSCGKPGAAAAGGAAGAGAAGAAHGISTGATVAIVGGVAVGGTFIGLAAAGTFSSSPASNP